MSHAHFYCACYASAVCAVIVHLCLCVCVKLAKPRIMQTMPHDSPGILMSKDSVMFEGVVPAGAKNVGGVY